MRIVIENFNQKLSKIYENFNQKLSKIYENFEKFSWKILIRVLKIIMEKIISNLKIFSIFRYWFQKLKKKKTDPSKKAKNLEGGFTW